VADEFLVPAAPPPASAIAVREPDLIGDAKKRAFLEAFADTGNVSAAARAADVGRRTHYDWLKKDKDYKAAFEAAVEDAADALELEARARALGEQDPVFNKAGELVGHRKKASDLLMIFLLKGLRPEKYAQQHVVAGKGKGGAILLEHIVAGVLTDDEKAGTVVDGELA
jgi:transposase-like protein